MKRTIALFVDGLSVPAKEGLTTHYLDLANLISASRQWRVLMVVADRDRASHSDLASMTYDSVLLPASDYYDFKKVRELLKRYNVSIAQNYNPHYFSTILAPASRNLGIATVYEIHDYEVDLAFLNSTHEETLTNLSAQLCSIQAATHTRILSKYDFDKIVTNHEGLPIDRISCIPFGVQRNQKIETQPSSNEALFIGNSFYPPNAQACKYIVESLAPKLPNVTFHLVGRGTDRFAKGTNVKAHGEVDDLDSLLSSASVGIAPIAMGSGMKIKILTYLASGLPCVASDVAMAGFQRDEHAISVADENTFATKISEKINDHTARFAAERYFSKHCDSAKLFNQVKDLYFNSLTASYTWDAPAAGEFDPSRLHWLKEAANESFGRTVNKETVIKGSIEQRECRVIVIEGLPGSGKTTLLDSLRRALPEAGFVDEMPYGSDQKDEAAYLENDQKKQTLIDVLSGDFIIVDRNFCSTLAFAYAQSRITGDDTHFIAAQKWVSESIASSALRRPALYIYLDISAQQSIDRRSAQSSDWGGVEFAEYAKEWYEAYFSQRLSCPVVRYDAELPTSKILKAISRNPEIIKLTKFVEVLD